jgi:hypothetical protein
VYDNNTDAGYAIFGTGGTINTGIGSETLILSGSAVTNSPNASGLAQTISPAGLSLNDGTGLASDYTFTGGTDTVLITPLQLTITGLVANNKSYNATTSATLSNDGSLVGIIGGQTLTLNAPTSVQCLQSNVGNGLTVRASGYSLSNGTSGTIGLASNYSLTGISATATTTADITPAIINLTGTRVYDAGTDAAAGIFSAITGINGQTLTLSGTGTLAGENTGNESVTSLGTLALGNGTGLASNYTLVGGTDTVDITPATLTETATPANSIYGSSISPVTGTITGFVGSDTQSSATSGTLTFSTTATSSSNVGTYGIDGSGLTAINGNYTIVQAASNATAYTVNPAIINLTGTRVYDAGTDAAAGIFSAITGINGQTLTLSGTGTLAGENTGNESVTSLGTLALGNGTGLASNYTLVGGTDTVDITPATLTETATPANSIYGSAISSVTGTITGFVGSDTQSSATSGTLTFSTTATSSSNVGTYGIDGSGLTAINGNYTIVQAASNATAYTVNPAVISLTGTRVYDANTDANAGIFSAITGINGQTLTLSGTGTLAGENTGNESVTSLGTLALGNGTGLASNYTLVGGTDTVTITPAPLLITGTTVADNKVYDTTTAAILNTTSTTLSGVLGSDVGNVSISGGTGQFATPDVGNAIPVAVTGFTLVGSASHNYFIVPGSYPTALVANITPAPLTVVGTTTADNKTYDGTTVATINTLNASLQGVLGSDSVFLDGGTGNFITSAVGNNIPVDVTSLIIQGPSAGNYEITSVMPTGVTADILPSPSLINVGVAGYWFSPSNVIITDDTDSVDAIPPQTINDVAAGMAVGILNAPWKKGRDGNQFAVYEDILGVPTLVYASGNIQHIAARPVGKAHLAGHPLATKSLVGLRITRRSSNHN